MSTTKFILRPGTWKLKKPKKSSEKLKNGKKKRETYCPKPDKETSIYLQYVHNGEKRLLLTGQKCEPRYWNKKQGKPKDSNLDEALNSLRTNFKKNAISKVIGEPEPDKVFEAWAKYLEEEKKKVPEAVLKGSILDLWSEYLTYLGETLHKGKKRTKGTIRNNENSRKLLSDFLEEKKRKNLKPKEFTIIDFEQFEAYLVSNLSPNSVSKVKKHFKSFLKWFLRKKKGLLGFNISDIEYSETSGLKISLTEDQLKKIANYDFKDKHLNHVRDLIILQCSTGVRVSDLQRLCDHITEDKNYFVLDTKKTGKKIKLAILPMAKEVLKRRNYRIPYMPEQYYRAGIKAIYKDFWPNKSIEKGSGDNITSVKIHEEISTHDMVRTFINIAWKKGISVPTIAIYTGKSIGVITKNYLEEDADYASQEILEKFDISPLKVAR